MAKDTTKLNLTGSLEDYLETILLLSQKSDQVRVKDIAGDREVSPPSVSLALGKLSKLGLVTYYRREFVTLTTAGEREARRVYSRHQLLSRFCEEVLLMSPAAASNQACAMEHVLTDEGMDGLARFFEYLAGCPILSRNFLEDYRQCSIVSGKISTCGEEGDRSFSCSKLPIDGLTSLNQERKTSMSLAKLTPGSFGIIAQIDARGAIRQRLLDMGLLPEVELVVERVAPSGDPIWIKIEGSQIALRLKEAQAVLVVPT